MRRARVLLIPIHSGQLLSLVIISVVTIYFQGYILAVKVTRWDLFITFPMSNF